MMKVVIFALVAFLVCFSKSSEFPKLDRDEVQLLLGIWFELKPDDLQKECDVVFESAWQEIGASLAKFQKAFDDVNAEVIKGNVYYSEKIKNQVKAKCQKSDTIKNLRMAVVKTALPCADKESLKKHAKTPKNVAC